MAATKKTERVVEDALQKFPGEWTELMEPLTDVREVLEKFPSPDSLTRGWTLHQVRAARFSLMRPIGIMVTLFRHLLDCENDARQRAERLKAEAERQKANRKTRRKSLR